MNDDGTVTAYGWIMKKAIYASDLMVLSSVIRKQNLSRDMF